MVKQVSDLTVQENNTLATRLRKSRDEAGYTRKQMFEKTGIPERTIGKYEYGEAEPTIARLKKICEVLGVSERWIIDGEETVQSIPATEEVKETGFPEHTPELAEVEAVEPQEQLEQSSFVLLMILLRKIDDFRNASFQDARRKTDALVSDGMSLMKYLEPSELIRVAEKRGLYQDEYQTSDFLDELFQAEPEAAKKYCGNLEERIIDTAIVGVDLFAIDREALVILADQIKEKLGTEDSDGTYEADVLERPKRLGLYWGDHEDFVPLIRPYIREMVVSGTLDNISDKDAFPLRTDEQESDDTWD